MQPMGLVAQPPYPWLIEPWKKFADLVIQDRLPHAILLVGQSGLGILDLAKAMAQFLLCLAPKEGASCGQCKSCGLLKADSHPDLHWVVPEEGAVGIKVTQIREMMEFTFKTAQQGGKKLVILSPAEGMNTNSSNALLKSLEEPNGDCIYLLVTEQPAFLLATIRSRCSRLDVRTPSFSKSLEWLERNKISNAESLLKAVGGRPLRVLEWLDNNMWEQREALRRELLGVIQGKANLLDSAKQLNGFSPTWVIEQIQLWLLEAAKVSNIETSQVDALVASLVKQGVIPIMRLYESIGLKKKNLLSGANPNTQLLLEEVLLDIKEVFGTVASKPRLR